jgi:hypothetical protein
VNNELREHLWRRAKIEAISSPAALVLGLIGYVVPRFVSETSMPVFTWGDLAMIAGSFAVSCVGATWLINLQAVRRSDSAQIENEASLRLRISGHDDVSVSANEQFTCSVFVALEGRADTAVFERLLSHIQADVGDTKGRPREASSSYVLRDLPSDSFDMVVATTFVTPNPVKTAFAAARLAQKIAHREGVGSSVWLVRGPMEQYRDRQIVAKVAERVSQAWTGSIALVGGGVSVDIEGIRLGRSASIRVGSGRVVEMVELQGVPESS